ncbi:uncharacterized protein LOC122402645 [Colletes gigas]|uniref:uncharacterized protein LOC122402645 n=1 Tax=Colletes gigas TaxID=935657 RepID=UPI001C9B718F|nr:uncharacterized protein LOC122402645 [Colletes gigas]
MLSEAECSFSTDSLDDRAIRDESSTIVSECSSTRTLMNIDDEGKRCFDEEETTPKSFFLSRRYSDTMEMNATEYSWELNAKGETFERNIEKETRSVTATEIGGKTTSGKVSRAVRKKKSETSEEKCVAKKNAETKTVSVKMKRDSVRSATSKSSTQKTKLSASRSVVEKSARSPSPVREKRAKISEPHVNEKQKYEKQKCSKLPWLIRSEKSRRLASSKLTRESRKEESYAGTIIKNKESEKMMEFLGDQTGMKIVLDFDEFPPPRSEKKSHFLNVTEPGFHLSPIEENSEVCIGSGQCKVPDKATETTLEYDHARKYHTYPKSRIPVARWSKERRFGKLMDPKMYPLEPREIDLEAFQQLHTADSQEELQEFLLLESQCSGNLGLAGNMSTSEVSCSEHHSEDERGTMSDY